MVSTTSDARDTGNDQRVSVWDEKRPGMDQWFPTTKGPEDTNLTSFSCAVRMAFHNEQKPSPCRSERRQISVYWETRSRPTH